MTIVEVFIMLGSIFTGISVLFAIYVYKNKEERNLFSRLRRLLLEENQNCIELSEILDEPLFTEISHNIVKELKQILPSNYNRDSLIKYFMNDSNHDYILQSIHLGFSKSKSLKSAKKLIKEIEKIPYEYRDPFPILYEITKYLNSYVIASCTSILSSSFYSSIINEPENYKEFIEDEFINKTHENDPLWEVTLLMIASSNVAMEVSQNISDEALKILGILVSRFSRFTDREFKKEKKRQNKTLSVLSMDTKEDYVEQLFNFLKLIKTYFSDEEWDDIVEAKTRLYDNLKKQIDEE